MATLLNKGNGKWKVTISGGYNPDGSQIRIVRTISVNPAATENSQRKQVEREAAALETDYRRHIITDAKKIRLSAVFEEYLERPMAESTRSGYKSLYERRIKPKLGDVYVQDLTARQIREFYKYLEKDAARPANKISKKEDAAQPKTRSKTGKLSGTSRLHYHQALSAVLNFAVKSGYIAVNPITAVDRPKQDTKEADFLQDEDIAKLMDVLESYPDPMWKAFFTLDIYSSCRPGELIALDWTDLDGNILYIQAGSNQVKGVGTVRTSQPKNKSSIRKIILPEEAMKALREWKIAQMEDRLKIGSCWAEPNAMFTGPEGNRLYISSPTHKWREIQKKYELKDVPLYSLRHTGASLLIAAGCDVKEVSGRLGHSRASTTLDRYTHLFEKVSQHTTDVMSAAIANARAEAK